ncbi:MAG: membrane protein insertion efficiency factor YidD [Treponema sp.]|nr:membrane protein insertion efficiency factor YidD [Treponema sp.]
MSKIILTMIRVYQLAISPHFQSCCRYYPTCSRYMYQAIQKYGTIKGIFLGLKRLMRCHPFHSGGYDPVP